MYSTGIQTALQTQARAHNISLPCHAAATRNGFNCIEDTQSRTQKNIWMRGEYAGIVCARDPITTLCQTLIWKTESTQSVLLSSFIWVENQHENKNWQDNMPKPPPPPLKVSPKLTVAALACRFNNAKRPAIIIYGYWLAYVEKLGGNWFFFFVRDVWSEMNINLSWERGGGCFFFFFWMMKPI